MTILISLYDRWDADAGINIWLLIVNGKRVGDSFDSKQEAIDVLVKQLENL